MRTALLMALVASANLALASDVAPERARFEELPDNAEVHAVTISAPFHYGVGHEEITDWQALIKALRATDGPGAHIRKRLPEGAERIVNERAEMGKLDDVDGAGVALVARARLSRELQPAMWATTFYDKDAFAGVKLPKSATDLIALGAKRTVYQNELLNRELLTLVFPNCIGQVPDDFQTVYVTVKPGKPVVLVTSAYHQTRWKVTVEKGATVAGVIQFGNTAREVVGTDAPIVYRANTLPNGKKGPVQGFNAYKQDDNEPSYKRIKAEVKEYTGQGFTSFQGLYQATKEPFVVTPGKK